MNQLITALRSKYQTPGEVMRALALDESLLREETTPQMSNREKAAKAGLKTMLAEDASLEEITEFVRALSALETGGAAEEEGAEEDSPFEEEAESEDEPNAGVPGLAKEGEEVATDEPAAAIHAILKDKLSPEELAQIGELLEKIAAPEGEEEGEHDPEVEEVEEKVEPEEEKAEGEDEDKDEEDDMTQNTQEKEPLVTKPAMDEAIRSAVAAAEKRAKANAKEVRDAEHAVRPWVGELSMAFDSAEDVYRQALTMLKVPDAKTIHASALATVLKLTPRPGQQNVPAREVSIGMDSAAADTFGKMFPGAGRIELAY